MDDASLSPEPGQGRRQRRRRVAAGLLRPVLEQAQETGRLAAMGSTWRSRSRGRERPGSNGSGARSGLHRVPAGRAVGQWKSKIVALKGTSRRKIGRSRPRSLSLDPCMISGAVIALHRARLREARVSAPCGGSPSPPLALRCARRAVPLHPWHAGEEGQRRCAYCAPASITPANRFEMKSRTSLNSGRIRKSRCSAFSMA
jgi:hypothetical protein